MLLSAHHTQFTTPGWRYLTHGAGVGTLAYNGTYVAYSSPDTKQLTIVITTMVRPHTTSNLVPVAFNLKTG